MEGMIPVLLILSMIQESIHRGRVAEHPWLTVALVGGLVAGWWLVCEAVTRWLAAPARRPRLAAAGLASGAVAGAPARTVGDPLARWEDTAQLLALALFALLCFRLDWMAVARSYTLGALPWVLFQVLFWWCLAPTQRPAGAGWSRTTYAVQQLRFSLTLPALLLLPVLDCCFTFATRSGFEAWLVVHGAMDLANGVGGVLLAFVATLVFPSLVLALWGARPLPAGAAHDELSAACRRAGVRVRGLRYWATPLWPTYNALVIGLLPRLRHVLFSADLLRDLPPAARIAVIGHELGHVRHRHLWIYLLFFLPTGIIALLAKAPLDSLLQYLGAAHLLDGDLRKWLVVGILLLIQARLLFGHLSRLCERQADLAGAALAGAGDLPAGCAVMRGALLDVARLTQTDPATPNWGHHSISERARYLDGVAVDPALAERHHRRVRLTVGWLAGGTAVLLLALAIVQLRGSFHLLQPL